MPKLSPPRRQRRAYILIIVLGFTAVVSALGMAFLDANSTVMPEAVNYYGTMRANYEAGTGVALASHYLMYPPTTLTYGQYWSGVSNTSFDGTNDYVSVTVSRSDSWNPPQSDQFKYRITSTGVAVDPDGSIRAKKTVTTDIIALPAAMWLIPQAVIARGSITFSSGVRINGDVYAVGTISGFGFCQGNLTASGISCLWLGTGPPASMTFLAPVISPLPSTNTALYSSYQVQGQSYTAYTGFANSKMAKADADGLNGTNMTSTNPGRIIKCASGDFTTYENVALFGCLVVSGKLLLDTSSGGPSTRSFSAVQYFPVLVVSGDIKVLQDDVTCTFNGPVFCGGKIDNNGRQRTNLTFNGPVFVQAGAAGTNTSITLTYNYTPSRATFWDFEGTAPTQPMTFLNWFER